MKKCYDVSQKKVQYQKRNTKRMQQFASSCASAKK